MDLVMTARHHGPEPSTQGMHDLTGTDTLTGTEVKTRDVGQWEQALALVALSRDKQAYQELFGYFHRGCVLLASRCSATNSKRWRWCRILC